MKTLITALIVFLSITPSFCQEFDVSLNSIPSNLHKNANAIVRKNSIEINIEDLDEMIVKETSVVTVLNKKGDSEIDTYVHYDNDTKITKLSAKIYDASGKEIKKYSKKKFNDASAVDGGTLYSDSRVKYIEYTPSSYPYTVVFLSEYKTSSTGFIPTWHPIKSFNLSVENSEYKILNPKKFDVRFKEKNFSNYPIEKVSKSSISYKITNQPALKYESNSISIIDIVPSLLVALDRFTLKGISGKGNNWKIFGKWMNDKLLFGKNKLNKLTIDNAKKLVENAKSDVEKAKILYKYMQDKTRYISVQVGIGGWEPSPANEVDKLSYGDCKGLTNYTKALFDAVGIKSNYTVVYAKNRRDIDSDFASIQGNHVILNIPNNGDDIWLECTSKTLPFGFLGTFTDDRNVLVITPEGGVIKRTPAYKNENNLQTTKATIKIDSLGNATANLTRVSKGIQYDNIYEIENKSTKQLKDYYKTTQWSYNNNLEVNSVLLFNNKEKVTFTESLNISIQNYAIKNQGELLLRANVFNKNSYVPKRYRKRNSPLKIDRGYKDVDVFTFKTPKGYSIKETPISKKIETKFGEYNISITKKDENTLVYKKSILIKEGTYPKEDYKLYRKFRRSISRLENLEIILTKN